MYIIFDLEASCWENAPEEQKQQMETIEIGAVEVDDKFNPTGREYQSFIKPFVVPQLSDFCTQLTTITQEQVDSARDFHVVFKEFIDWSNLYPSGIRGANCVLKPRFISWGHYDYNQLTKDCARFNMEMFDKRFHINGKELYKDFTGRVGRGLGSELKKQKMVFEGTKHRGIDDSKNIAKLLWKVHK